jgi:hypothetical protein
MTSAERVVTLRAELRTVAARFCAACAELEPLAAELADLDAHLLAAEGQCGIFTHRARARELAAEVVHGHLGALRPHISYVGPEAAALAEAQLRRSPTPASPTAM